MKKNGMGKKLRAVLLLVMVCLVAFGMQAQAAAKNGLVKKGSKYYYVQNGKTVKNAWKTVKQSKVKYKYYFGKNGAAYKASMPFDKSYNVKTFKIKNKTYGFDALGHLVKGGVYVDQKQRLYVFTSKGIYDAVKTKELRSKLGMFKAGMRVDQIRTTVSPTLYSVVKEALGEPLKEARASSCLPLNETDIFTDVNLIYPYFEVQFVYNENTGEYAASGIFSAIVK